MCRMCGERQPHFHSVYLFVVYDNPLFKSVSHPADNNNGIPSGHAPPLPPRPAASPYLSVALALRGRIPRATAYVYATTNDGTACSNGTVPPAFTRGDVSHTRHSSIIIYGCTRPAHMTAGDKTTVHIFFFNQKSRFFFCHSTPGTRTRANKLGTASRLFMARKQNDKN